MVRIAVATSLYVALLIGGDWIEATVDTPQPHFLAADDLLRLGDTAADRVLDTVDEAELRRF